MLSFIFQISLFSWQLASKHLGLYPLSYDLDGASSALLRLWKVCNYKLKLIIPTASCWQSYVYWRGVKNDYTKMWQHIVLCKQMTVSMKTVPHFILSAIWQRIFNALSELVGSLLRWCSLNRKMMTSLIFNFCTI